VRVKTINRSFRQFLQLLGMVIRDRQRLHLLQGGNACLELVHDALKASTDKSGPASTPRHNQ
jgi:hypothetical protein